MRTVGDIVEAVQEQQPVTEEELKLTVVSLYYALTMVTNPDYQTVSDTVLRYRAKENFEMKFRLLKADPITWLGPNWTPGTPENTKQREASKKILKAFEKSRKKEKK